MIGITTPSRVRVGFAKEGVFMSRFNYWLAGWLAG